MGNCTERYSERDKLRHCTKQKNKNDKNFICLTDEDCQLPMLKQFLPNLKALVKELKHEKHKFKKFYEGTSEETCKRTLIEVQKGVGLCKPSCLERKKVLVRVSLEDSKRVFDTDLTDFELPIWNQFFEVDGEVTGDVRFEVLVHRPTRTLKKVGEFVLKDKQLIDQKVFFRWVNLEKMKGEENGMILIKVQKIFDEKELYLNLFNACQEKIEKIKEFIEMNEEGL
jgi:hypothetical protein